MTRRIILPDAVYDRLVRDGTIKDGIYLPTGEPAERICCEPVKLDKTHKISNSKNTLRLFHRTDNSTD